MIEEFLKLQTRYNNQKEQINENVKENMEMYKIIVEWEQGRREININKNLTINNLTVNLQDEEQVGKVLTLNNTRL